MAGGTIAAINQRVLEELIGRVAKGTVYRMLSETFTATAGQVEYVLTEGTYLPGNSHLFVYVQGIKQSVDDGNVEETAADRFTLLCDPADIPAGTKVEATWWEGVMLSVSAPANHAVTHEVEGTDPLVLAQSQITGLPAAITTIQADVVGRGINVMSAPYNAKGDGIADDTASIQSAINAVGNAGGGVVFLPKGTYRITNVLDISGINNLTIMGLGVDVSNIVTNSPTSDVFVSTTDVRWQKFKDFTVSSSVTKTSGAHFNYIGAAFRVTWENVKIKGHFNGIKLDGFEQCWINKVHIAEPTGAGTAIIVGKVATITQGANLNIVDCFIRGSGGLDGVEGTVVGNYGVVIYDCDAVFMMNTDIGAVIENNVMIAPSTTAGNHYFSQCFFDATKNGDCVLLAGLGTKREITFTGCWFASGGQVTGGLLNASGLNCKKIGSYRGLSVVGGRVFNCKGSGVKYSADSGDAVFVGVQFQYNGLGQTVNDNYGMLLDTGLNNNSARITGCAFTSSDGHDLYVSASSRKYTVQDCYMEGTFSNNGQADKVNGIRTGNSNVVASATNLTFPSGIDFVRITGTTNITGSITPTFIGHVVTLKFDGALLISQAGNIRLNGGATWGAIADSTLTIVCDGAQWYEIGRKD